MVDERNEHSRAGSLSEAGLGPGGDATLGRGEGEKAASGGKFRRTSRTGKHCRFHQGGRNEARRKIDGSKKHGGSEVTHSRNDPDRSLNATNDSSATPSWRKESSHRREDVFFPRFHAPRNEFAKPKEFMVDQKIDARLRAYSAGAPQRSARKRSVLRDEQGCNVEGDPPADSVMAFLVSDQGSRGSAHGSETIAIRPQ